MNENVEQTNKQKIVSQFFLSAGETLLLLLDIRNKNNKCI